MFFSHINVKNQNMIVVMITMVVEHNATGFSTRFLIPDGDSRPR